VGGGVAIGFLALHGTGDLDQIAEQKQLFGDGGFTGIGVRDDRKGTATGDLFVKSTHQIHSAEWGRGAIIPARPGAAPGQWHASSDLTPVAAPRHSRPTCATPTKVGRRTNARRYSLHLPAITGLPLP